MNKKLLAIAVSSSIILSIGAFQGQDRAYAQSTAKVVQSVSLREAPSVSGDRIRYLKSGESIEILDNVNSYWYKVKDSGNRVGYVSTSEKYIELSAQTSPSAGSNAQIVISVSFRTGPSTNNSRIRYLQQGEQVTILEKPNSYWYKVQDRNGTIGYVSSHSEFIKTNFTDSGNNGVSNPVGQTNPSELAQKVISAGMKYLGTPYEFGSSRYDTTTFDCSDFVRQAFLDGAGIKLPADSRQQGAYVQKIGKVTTDWRQLKPGDIMFFMSYKGSKASSYNGIDKSSQRITHDGIYLGDGKVLHTYSKEAGGVKIDTIEGKHWEYRFMFGGSAY